MFIRASSARQFLKGNGLTLVLLALVGVGIWLILTAAKGQRPSTAATTPAEFHPQRYTTPEMPFTELPIVSVAEAKDALQPEELVLGVTVGGQSRAYPLNALNEMPRQKAVNDTLGGKAILATWCDLSHTGTVYERSIDGRTLSLAISGQLWQDNMVLYDQETRTLWSQLPGEGKNGPLEGRRLHRIPSIVTDWQSWRRLYPKSTVLLLPASRQEFHRDFYQQPENFVLGIAEGEHARAWGLDVLRQSRVLNEEWAGKPVLVVFDLASSTAALYERQIETEVLTFRLAGDKVVDERTGSRWNLVTGEAESGSRRGRRLRRLPAVLATRTVWNAFHPSSN